MAQRADPLITDKRLDIPDRDLWPHTSDSRFWHDRIGALTVFLMGGKVQTVPVDTWEEVPGLHYINSIVLANSASGDAHTRAWHAARREAGSENNVVFFEGYAARLLGRSAVDIQHILSTVGTAGSGNPHQYLGIAE